MYIEDFLSTYELHDSLLTKVAVNGSTLELTIDFCYWMQDGYQESDPETGTINLSFVRISEYSGPSGDINEFSILRAEYHNGIFTLLLLDDFNNKSYTLCFRSKSDSITITVPQ